jgi:exodeoxyribonuclease-3
MKRIFSWNVNGIRAAAKKGLFDWMVSSAADVIGLQETKAQIDQLDESFFPKGYHYHFYSAVKKGYSGVALYSKEEPLSVEPMGIPEFDNEGRFLAAKFPEYTFVTAYFPNSQDAGKRLDYKIAFCDALLEWSEARVAAGENLVICGDYNIAHKPIDLARPKQNEKNPGYLPEERAWMDKFTDAGWIDTFRVFNQEPEQYSWWSYRLRAREKNIGWRIDYHCINPGLKEKLLDAKIHQDVLGSDHCPVSIDLDV